MLLPNPLETDEHPDTIWPHYTPNIGSKVCPRCSSNRTGFDCAIDTQHWICHSCGLGFSQALADMFSDVNRIDSGHKLIEYEYVEEYDL